MTTLVEALRELLGESGAGSFRLAGEDLALLPAARLVGAAAAYQAELRASVPAALQARFEDEQQRLLRTAHGWLRRYNRSLHGRVAGYLALGRLCRFEYPWPVVAVLGICQVLSGLSRNRLYGLLGPVAERVGVKDLWRAVEATEDILRRTNRGIFADSTPTVLLALRCHDLRTAGEREVAEALLAGPLPPIMDGECRTLARGLFEALALPDGRARFIALAALTLRHFDREQAIFTYQLGPAPRPPPRPSPTAALLRRLFALRSVPAPVVERTLLGGRRVVFRPFALPRGFDIYDHAARVEAFGRAFVGSVTADLEDYRAAVRYVVERFGRRGDGAEAPFPNGGAPLTGMDVLA
jgi:hypothetical protein